MKIAVLGCGPSGLLAAWAAKISGAEYRLFSVKQMSRLGGAQFLHEMIPYLTDESNSTMIEYVVRGHAEVYKEKVYNNDPRVPFVSFDKSKDGAQVEAWNLRQLYDRLWAIFEQDINDALVSPSWFRDEGIKEFDLVLSTIPATNICRFDGPASNHWFKSQPIRIYNDCIIESTPDNVIVYDGTKDYSWYRMSRLWGTGSTEWNANGPIPPVKGLVTVNKPIDTNCDCWPEVHRLGRFGQWKKGVLTHDAFQGAVELIQKGIDR